MSLRVYKTKMSEIVHRIIFMVDLVDLYRLAKTRINLQVYNEFMSP